jgi:hypothetical protein
MPARQAVLLTPSKLAALSQLLSYKQSAAVSPLFATLTKSAYLYHSTPFSHPLFSYSYALFCPQGKVISRLFKQYRTLWQKHPGVGGCSTKSQQSVYLFFASWRLQTMCCPGASLCCYNQSPALRSCSPKPDVHRRVSFYTAMPLDLPVPSPQRRHLTHA